MSFVTLFINSIGNLMSDTWGFSCKTIHLVLVNGFSIIIIHKLETQHKILHRAHVEPWFLGNVWCNLGCWFKLMCLLPGAPRRRNEELFHKVEDKGREFEKQNAWANCDTPKEFLWQTSEDGLTRWLELLRLSSRMPVLFHKGLWESELQLCCSVMRRGN